MRRATIDDRLSARIVSVRPLVYTTPANPDDDRPAHVRAASGITALGDRLVVVQDDASFIAIVDPGPDDSVHAIALPFGPNQRRRFEVELGNKLDKLDLESCVAIDDEVWGFGSGSLPVRESVVRVRGNTAVVMDGTPLYRALREQLGDVNIEGATRQGNELWLFHRGNCGPSDRGPAVVRIALASVAASLTARTAPSIIAVERFDLGSIAGQPLGFTDAASRGDRVFYVAAAEASPDAIEDGAVLGSQLGVFDADGLRATPLVGIGGDPLKVEGLAFVGERIFVTLDPDDPAQPTPLCEVALDGPW